MGCEFIEEEISKREAKRKWQFRLLALFCAVFFSAGSHFSTYAINSLKSSLKLHMALDNTQYGAAQASMYLINTIMPLLGGIFMDRFGTAYGAVLSSSLILLGSILVATSTHMQSFPLLVVGRVFHGLGSGVIVVAQETILGKWFSGSIIGTVIGLQIGSSRLFSFIAQGTSPSFAKAVGYYGASLWMAVGVCAISWGATLVYAFILMRAGGEVLPGRRSEFSLRRLLYLPVGFWSMPFTIMLLGGVWTPFLGSVTEFVKSRWGTTDEISAWTGSVSLVIPVLLSPSIGGIIDRFGKRSLVLFLSCILCTVSMALLGYTMISPLVGLVLFSISLTIGPVALTSSVPLLLPTELIGTGIGAHKMGLSVGVALLHLLVGHVQDATPNRTYANVTPLLIAVSVAALLMSLVYALYSHQLLGLFDAPLSRRKEILEAGGTKIPANCSLEELDTKKLANKVLVATMGSLILVCWGVFIWSILDSPAQYFRRFKLN
ncbi:hypothetical protein DSO57_1028030 [Entomophthora muscae]|uniref:Uncharacterized protein n=1 Tax=Entomophthora muscae TaxID=34485 RepID=A0ACC2SQU5_9FUNG|nr:hypothetical protein DSO57_1028030 [Entomophthora muscae]